MKKLFIYYSNTGNGDFLASVLAEREFEPHKIETLKPIKKMNFFGIFKYGFLAATKKLIKIKDLEIVFDFDQDEVVIGSPIWNDRLSNPVLTLLSSYGFNKETTQFVLYAGGGKANHAIKQLETFGFKKAPIVLKQPLSDKEASIEALKNL